MAFIPTPNVARTSLEFVLGGDAAVRAVNTLWHFNTAAEWDATSLGNLNSALATWWDTHMAPSMSTLCSLTDITSVAQYAIDAPSITDPLGPVISGNLTGSVAAFNATFVIKFLTAARGRTGRGRNYIPLLRENDIDDNSHFNQTRAGELVTAYDQLRDPGLNPNWIWGMVSFQSEGVKRDAGLFRAITGVTYTDLNVDSQRRRLPGRGT